MSDTTDPQVEDPGIRWSLEPGPRPFHSIETAALNPAALRAYVHALQAEAESLDLAFHLTLTQLATARRANAQQARQIHDLRAENRQLRHRKGPRP